MREKFLRYISGVALLLCISFLARGTTTISGPTVVCVGSTDAYTANGHTGLSYKWSVTTTGVARVTGTLATADVTWNSTGSYTLKVVVDSLGAPIDSTTLSVAVVAPPSPYITTISRVACQSYDTAKYGIDPPHVPLILSDTDGCIKVCSGSVVKYYVNGGLPTDKISWAVTGGNIIGSSTADSVIVRWNNPGAAGQIMVTDTSLGGCIGSYKVCITIIAKPKASFTVDTATVPVSSYNICFGVKTQFNDLSTAATGSSISNWYWIFGDGTTSADPNPSHIFPKGTFTVKEVVSNQCGCTDTFSVTLNVSKTPGPKIYVCPRPTIVCQGDTVTYYTDNCGGPGSYNWSWNPLYAHPVAGGPPYTNQSITLMWDSANADGYGTISLGVTCTGSCTGVTTLKIPVIQRHPTVTGPVSQKLCTGVPYNFSIPLWPGTRYDWGVIRDSAAIISGRHSNSVNVQFGSPGIYTIHVWYQNALSLCGSDVKFQVQVASPVAIIGRRTVCLDSAAVPTYTVTGTAPATWTLEGPGGYSNTASVTIYSLPTLTTPGVYTLTATGPSFCSPAVAYINVVSVVPNVDFVTGDLKICTGRPYTYVAHNDIAGYSYQWTVSGGTASTLAGDSTIVTWTSSGTITAQRINSGGGCPGPLLSLPVTVTNLFTDVNLTGNTSVCANGTENYDDGVPDADVTTWAVFPDSLGSVVSGNYSSNVNVLWNNIHSTQVADLIVTVTKCGVVVHDTLKVTVHPNPVITVTGPVGAQCRDNQLSFTASAPVGTPPAGYTWSFGDLTTGSSVSNTTTHAYFPPVSAGTGAVTYTVRVTANGPSSTCPVEGVGITTVQVYPGTFPSISTTVPITYCSSVPHITMNSAVTNASGTVTYAWYRKFPTTSVGTGTTYTTAAPDSGTYFLVTHDATGCYDTSNFITVTNLGPCPSCPRPSMTLTNACNGKISGSTTATSGFSWIVTPGGFTSTSAAPTFTFSSPGYYQFSLSATVGTCTGDSLAIDSVGLITGLYWDWTCPGAGANYTVNLHDNSQKLPDWHYTSNSWTVQLLPTGPSYTSSSANFSQALPPGTYLVTYSVGAAGGSSSQTCTVTDTLVVPGKPTFSITEVTSPICEGVPIAFTAVAGGTMPPGLSDYSWSFGDGSFSLVPSPDRTYKFNPSGHIPNFNIVNLAVIDSLGCSYTSSAIADTVYQNTFGISGFVVGGPASACDGSTVTLSYHPGTGDPAVTRYLWTDGTTASTDIVAVSGNYNVAVYDLHQCRYMPNSPASVTILNPAALLITGARKVCYPNPVVLSDDLGSSYTYQWFRGGSFLVGTSATLVDNTTAGPYTYTLVVTTTFGGITCHDTSGVVNVVVEPQPAAPVISSITAVNCSLYELAMNVTTVTGFSYTWSNGAHGAADTITNGGAYRVWVTDTNGCVNYADTLIPYSPASYLAWFPVGCYNLCYQTLPDSLYGPPGSFTWSWLYNGGGIASGTNTAITPLGLNSPTFGPGDYQLSLSNVFCTNLSDTLNLTMGDCGPGSGCPRIFPGNPVPSITCDTNAAGYIVTLYLDTVAIPSSVTSLTFGFNIGPAIPFTVYKSGPYWGTSAYTFSFSTLTVPPPATALVKVLYDAGLGHPCMDTETIHLLPCSWPSEKMTPGDTAQQPVGSMQSAATGMVAYPNPAHNVVNVNYNFGYQSDKDRRIILYDVLGREVSEQKVTDMNGTISIPLGEVAAGSYIVRMMESGNTLHVAHVSVMH